MSPPACRYFNADGSPKNPPCSRGRHCAFIHPDDPRWRDIQHRSSSYGHKNERGRDPRRQSSASWNNRNASTSNSVIDNGWGPPKSHASQNDKPGWDTFKSPLGRRASSSSDNGWGPPMKQHQNGKRDVDPWPRRSSDGPGDSKGMGKDTYKDATSGWRAAESSEGWGSIHGAVSRWGDSDGTGGSGDGWGSNATTPTAAVVSGWGESSKTYKTTDSGWSESSKSMSASSSGWGEPSKTGTPISGGGAAPADSGTGATREANPRTSSGWVLEAAKEEGTRRESGWRTGTSDWDTRSKPSDPIFPPISHSASRATDINKAPPLAPRQMTPTLPAKKEKVPLPGRKTSSTIVTQQVIDQRNSPLERSLKINTNIIELEESMPSGTSTSARSAWTRDKIQKSTFQYMLQAVRYQIDLGVALADIERWKRLRSSAQFVRATPATQTVLQDQRLVYGKTSDTVETRLKTTIKYLSEIPQVSARADLISAETGKREMIHYIAQLRDWIGTVKVLYPNTPPEPEIEPETLIPATTVKRSKHPKELIWDQVDTLVNLVNDHIDDIYDLLEGREKRETPQDIESKFIALLKAHDMKQLAEAEAKSSGLLSELNQVGLDFKEVADETAELITTSFDQGKIVETLKTELEECETAKNQLAGYLAQMEEWKKEDASTIAQLKHRVKTLHSITRPAPPTLTSDEFMPHAERFALEYMKLQLDKVAAGIQRASADNSCSFIEEVYRQLEPIVKLTNDVCHRANAITSQHEVPAV